MPPKPLQHTRTRWDKNSSQADSAGSIPVTRSTREKRCSRTIFEGFRSVSDPRFGPRPGHFGPHLSTPRHSPSASEDAQLVPSCSPAVRFSALPTSPGRLRKFELDLDGLTYNAAEKDATSDPMQAPAR